MTKSEQIERLERQIRLERTNEKYIKVRRLKAELNQLQEKKKIKLKLPSTGKLIAFFLFVNFTIVEIYSMWAMYKLMDLSSLSTLITCVIGEVLTYFIYSLKSAKENMVGGIVYDMALKNVETSNEKIDNNTVG